MPQLGTSRSPVCRTQGEGCLLSGFHDVRASKWHYRYACVHASQSPDYKWSQLMLLRARRHLIRQ
jgi:hypothetical protein